MIISTNQMKRIFDKFNYQVSVKYYQKMPRDDWRKIKTAIKDGRMFILNIYGKAYLTFVENYNEPRTMISFERHDSSFGDFLYDLFRDDDKLEMIYCINDYLDKALWTSTSKDDTEDKYIKNKEYIKNIDNKEIINNFKLVDDVVKQGTGYIMSSQEVKEALDKVKLATSDYYNSVQPTAFASQSENIGSTSSTTSTTVTVGSTSSATTIQVGDYNIGSGKAIDGYTITNGTISLTDNIEDTARKVFNEEWNKRKENDKMKFGNFDFGPIKDNDNIRMSPYGLAVKNVNGTYQAYDKNSDEIMDVDVFNFKADNMFFKMPVAIDAIKVGDVIVFNRRPCFVAGFSEQGDVIAIDISLGEKKTILPTKSPFGFNFITKVMSLFDNMMTAPSNENPLGNMWMFALLDNDNQSMKDILPMMLLMNGVNGNTSFNPLMFYFMSEKNDKDNDWLLPMFMMNNFSGKIN
jgi:hypothetical protein